MSDAFADLWSSSAPSRPVQPQKLGAQTSTTAQKRQQPDVFALLSSSSNPPSRPATGFSQPQRPTPSPTPKLPTSTDGSGDAFSGLFTSSSSSPLNGNTRMTIAQRAAEAEKKKLEALRRHQHEQQAAKAQGSSAWDGLDSFMSPNRNSSVTTKTDAHNDDFGFESFAQPAAQPAAAQPSVISSSPFDDNDLLGDFGAAPKPSQPATRGHSQGWDSPPLERTRTDSPGDFNFGDRENRDALLGDSSNDEDDILGALSKPVSSIPKRKVTSPDSSMHTPAPPSRSDSSSRSKPSSRPVSPPPHILGQIVEMGFSIQQARVALASTDTGLDVQAALDTLLSNGAASSSSSPPRHTQSPQSPDYQPSGPPPKSASHLMAGQSEDSPSPSNRDTGDRNYQEQADKIISQASEIGLSMFNKASAFWKEGKERVQKAYVERAASAGSGAGASAAGGRPKWMQEARDNAGWDDEGDSPMKSAFADEPSSRRPGAAAPAKSRPQQEQPAEEAQSRASRIANLFGDDEPAAYISPFRRGKPKADATTPAASSSTGPSPPPPPARAAATATPPAPRSTPPKPRANLISCTSGALSRAMQYKTRGTEQFKLGQYAEAASSYTLGISSLPAGHLSLVPLYNNRALARLKTGEYAGAIEDASAVVAVVGESYHPRKEVKVEREEEGGGVDLGDGMVKALKRRAEAYEGRERWKEAERDWEGLAKLEYVPGQVRSEAVKSAGRCRRTVVSMQEKSGEAIAAAAAVSAKPKPKPKPVRPTRPAVSAKPSQAVSNLRSANEAAEAEDQQRHELKDSVDARLNAWKGGKEGNIRALLGSVDTVLWPELGLKKVGMAELVTSAQVKVRYTRVIARLHPDKLNAGNTTVEQRMIANAVFGVLNEAWNSFKQ